MPGNLLSLLAILFFLSACTTKFKEVDADQGEDVDAPDDGDTSEGEAECGNGIQETGEECDDGNREDGDGCQADCTLPCEDDGDCADGDVCNGVEICSAGDGTCGAGSPQADGFVCGETPRRICLGAACVDSACGDGFVDGGGGEFCEPPGTDVCNDDCQRGCTGPGDCLSDGNICNGDEFCNLDEGVCDRTEPPANGTDCGLSPRQICLGGSCQESICGDGFVDRYLDPPEECDDGNHENDDGCDNNCFYSCRGPGDCDDRAVCNGTETCNTTTHMCVAGDNAPFDTLCEDDELDCTRDVCNGEGLCEHPPQGGFCLIAGGCFPADTPHPGNSCMECNPAVAQDTWTQLPDGSPCTDLNPCTEDHCSSGACLSTPVTTLKGVEQVVLGSVHACALMTDRRTIRCWGANWAGQFGNGSTMSSYYPAGGPDLGQSVRMLAAGAQHTCAHLQDNTVRCWGHNNDRELGDGTGVEFSTVPVSPSGLADVIHIGAGWDHTCAVKGDGKAWCWGKRDSGQVGSFYGISTDDAPTPEVVYDDSMPDDQMAFALTIAGGANHTCALVESDRVRCWGLGASGQLGNDATATIEFPVYVLLTSTPFTVHESFSGLSAGMAHGCALTPPSSGANAAVRCWGDNTSGQLGDETYTNKSLPSTVIEAGAELRGIRQVSAGSNHTCAATVDDTARCWGSNGDGQLGIDPATARTASANTVTTDGYSTFANVLAIVAGNDFTCAIVGPDRDLYCWGRGDEGQLGNGETIDHSYPYPVSCGP